MLAFKNTTSCGFPQTTHLGKKEADEWNEKGKGKERKISHTVSIDLLSLLENKQTNKTSTFLFLFLSIEYRAATCVSRSHVLLWFVDSTVNMNPESASRLPQSKTLSTTSTRNVGKFRKLPAPQFFPL